ncbi:MAG: response regulator [Desulfobacteraceae bacterium]|nr:MAG: response regulator [Desulfobacteraceae bacterium]
MEKATVLVVDNQENVLKVIENALGTISYDIIVMKNGQEGFAQLQNGPVDIVLADQAMPDMDCLEFLTTVKREFPDVVTIMLAEQIDLDTTIRAINEAGVYRFILKPWNSFELRINVSRGIEFKRMVLEKRRLLEEIRENDAVIRRITKKFPGVERIIHQIAEENA